MQTEAGESKTRKRGMPWFKCYPERWLEDTRRLKPVERALYFDFLCLMYKHDGPLPNDDKWISHQLCVSQRAWRPVKDLLIQAGKIVVVGDTLTNPRASIELASRANRERTNAEIAANRERTKRENSEKANEINESKAGACFPRATDQDQQKLDGDPGKGKIIHLRDSKDRSFEASPDVDKSPSRPAAVPRFVSERALDQVRSIAPGWDRQHLLRKFLDWDGSKHARNPDKAFLAWVRSFTKGKAAS